MHLTFLRKRSSKKYCNAEYHSIAPLNKCFIFESVSTYMCTSEHVLIHLFNRFYNNCFRRNENIPVEEGLSTYNTAAMIHIKWMKPRISLRDLLQRALHHTFWTIATRLRLFLNKHRTFFLNAQEHFKMPSSPNLGN